MTTPTDVLRLERDLWKSRAQENQLMIEKLRNQLNKWKRESRKWESRAKVNKAELARAVSDQGEVDQ